MRFIVFDTETTGFGSRDEVLQFSAIVTNTNLDIEGYVDFYGYTTEKIPISAVEVHGIDSKVLAEKSNYKTFEDNFLNSPILNLDDCLWIGYSTGFDIRMVNQTLSKYGLPRKNFGRPVPTLCLSKGQGYFDLMSSYTKAKGMRSNIKLVEAVSRELEGGLETAKMLFKRQFNLTGLDAHNSLFDSYLTYLLLYKTRVLYV